jgi:transposase
LLAVAKTQPDWAVGFADEVWWSREALPAMHAFAPKDQPVHLVERKVPKTDPGPKAMACYGIYLRAKDQPTDQLDTMLLRFVEARPISAISEQFLHWVCQQLTQRGKRVLLLIWDNASWHVSQRVRAWIAAHNRYVKLRGRGLRIVVCLLPSKSPWLNPIEPKWIHGKRAVAEPAALLPADEVPRRVCAHFHHPLLPFLAIPKDLA